MSAVTLIALIQAFIGLIGQIPELVAAGETAIGLLKSGVPPTAEEQATIDAGLEAANTALQAS